MLWSLRSPRSLEQRVRISRLMELTLGALFLSQNPSCVVMDGNKDGKMIQRTNLITYLHQAFANLVRVDVRILQPILLDLLLDLGRGDARLAAADDARPDAARLLVAIQDLRHAAVRHAQLSADGAGPNALDGQLDDP